MSYHCQRGAIIIPRQNHCKYEEFADCIAWWEKREENERAWKVPVEQILTNDCNLDIKNPNGKTDLEHLPPEQLVEDILKKEQRIAEIMMEIKRVLRRETNNGAAS